MARKLDRDITMRAEHVSCTIGDQIIEENTYELTTLINIINDFLTRRQLSFLNIADQNFSESDMLINLFYDFPEDRWDEYDSLVSDLSEYINKGAGFTFTGMQVSITTEIDSYQLCIYINITTPFPSRKPIKIKKQ